MRALRIVVGLGGALAAGVGACFIPDRTFVEPEAPAVDAEVPDGRDASFDGALANDQPRPGARLGGAMTSARRLLAYVAQDGAVRARIADVGALDWGAAFALTGVGFASPSAKVAVAANGEHFEVFVIGNDGVLSLMRETDGGAFTAAIARTRAGASEPGGSIAIGRRGSGEPIAFFIGQDGSVYATTGENDGGAPVALTDGGTPMPKSGLAAVRQADRQLDVLGFDVHASLLIGWALDDAEEFSSSTIADATAAPPGADLAACAQSDDQVDAMFFDGEGQLVVYAVRGFGAWFGPIRPLGPVRDGTPGGAIAAARDVANDRVLAAFTNKDGALEVAVVTGLKPWDPPVKLTPPAFAPAGGGAAIYAEPAGATKIVVAGNAGLAMVTRGEDGTWSEPRALR